MAKWRLICQPPACLRGWWLAAVSKYSVCVWQQMNSARGPHSGGCRAQPPRPHHRRTTRHPWQQPTRTARVTHPSRSLCSPATSMAGSRCGSGRRPPPGRVASRCSSDSARTAWRSSIDHTCTAWRSAPRRRSAAAAAKNLDWWLSRSLFRACCERRACRSSTVLASPFVCVLRMSQFAVPNFMRLPFSPPLPALRVPWLLPYLVTP